jgi:hypothetical protein
MLIGTFEVIHKHTLMPLWLSYIWQCYVTSTFVATDPRITTQSKMLTQIVTLQKDSLSRQEQVCKVLKYSVNHELIYWQYKCGQIAR